jgi:hypothetical protein
MRTSRWPWTLVLLILAGAAARTQNAAVDPERILADRFHFTSAEVAQARQGQPVVKVTTESDELTGVGAIRLDGKKERLADWLKNIEHFRNAAELGTAHVIQVPITPAAFAGLTLDATDLAELKKCAAGTCDIRLPANVQAELQRDGGKANDIMRQMLFDYTAAYIKTGNAAVSPEMHGLIAKARTMTDLAPAFVTYLDGYPGAPLAGADDRFYWSTMPAGDVSIVSVHHLVQYRPRPDEIWIADKNLYATRYFDAAVTAIALHDAPGGGFYVIAGSRMKASALSGMAATILRRQVQRSAADTVKMYLEWIRDSLQAAR